MAPPGGGHLQGLGVPVSTGSALCTHAYARRGNSGPHLSVRAGAPFACVSFCVYVAVCRGVLLRETGCPDSHRGRVTLTEPLLPRDPGVLTCTLGMTTVLPSQDSGVGKGGHARAPVSG